MELIKKYSCKWTTGDVDREKARIKLELRGLRSTIGVSKTLKYVLREIKLLEEASSPKEGLTLFILIMSSLVHHEHFGGLSQSQVKKLIGFGLDVLKVNGVRSSKSRLAYLYGEIYLVKSQISLKSGDFWQAAWDQQIGLHSSGGSVVGGDEFQMISLGIRNLRLGHAHVALGYFTKADSRELTHDLKLKCRINLVRSIRLSGERNKALVLIKSTLEDYDFQEIWPELEWQKALCGIDGQASLRSIFSMVAKGKDHRSISYIVEVSLLALSLPSPSWESKVPKIRSLKRASDLDVSDSSDLLKILSRFEESRDLDIPFSFRLEKFGQALELAPKLRNIEHELLVWLAATRWLHRNRKPALAALSFAKYTQLSMSLSSHLNPDVLGIAADLMEHEWAQPLYKNEFGA